MINGEKWKIKIRQKKFLQKELQKKCINKGQSTRCLFLKDIAFIGQINNKTKASRQLCWPLSLVLFSFINVELDLLILSSFDLFTNTINRANSSNLFIHWIVLNLFEHFFWSFVSNIISLLKIIQETASNRIDKRCIHLNVNRNRSRLIFLIYAS